jgi:hypothetical protein
MPKKVGKYDVSKLEALVLLRERIPLFLRALANNWAEWDPCVWGGGGVLIMVLLYHSTIQYQIIIKWETSLV